MNSLSSAGGIAERSARKFSHHPGKIISAVEPIALGLPDEMRSRNGFEYPVRVGDFIDKSATDEVCVNPINASHLGYQGGRRQRVVLVFNQSDHCDVPRTVSAYLTEKLTFTPHRWAVCGLFSPACCHSVVSLTHVNHEKLHSCKVKLRKNCITLATERTVRSARGIRAYTTISASAGRPHTPPAERRRQDGHLPRDSNSAAVTLSAPARSSPCRITVRGAAAASPRASFSPRSDQPTRSVIAVARRATAGGASTHFLDQLLSYRRSP